MQKRKGKKPVAKWTPEKIKTLRDSIGESREEFAPRIGASKFTLRNIEQGQLPVSKRIDLLLDLVQANVLAGHIGTTAKREKQPA